MEHGMPILVFNYKRNGNILRAVRGDKVGTRIDGQAAGGTA
jgi:uridylate kinase